MSADLDEVVLRFDDLGEVVPQWTSYSYHDAYLTPAAGFSFTIGDPDIPTGLNTKIREGQKVSVAIGQVTICTGYIDEVHEESSRHGGTVFTFSGRDVLGDAVDSTLDPTRVYHPTQTLAEIIKDVMSPFGFTTDPIPGNDANRDLVTGTALSKADKYGLRTSKPSTAKHHRRQKVEHLSKAQTFQCKPHEREGAYEFCERLANRSGLHLRVSGDGRQLIVGAPDFAQAPKFKFIRRRGVVDGDRTNVVSGSSVRSRTNQPSVVVAAATGAGGDFPRAAMKAIAVNELIARKADGSLIPDVDAIVKKFPKAYVLGLNDFDGNISPLALNPYPRARPLYLYDAEAHSLEQLVNFTKRELSRRQRQAFTLDYTVEGHSQDGIVFAPDCIAAVDDDIADIHEEMWIESVSFRKDKNGGTTSHIRLIRPYTLAI